MLLILIFFLFPFFFFLIFLFSSINTAIANQTDDTNYFAQFAPKNNSATISILEEIDAKRDEKGGIIIYGKIKLPVQTKLMINFGEANKKEVLGQTNAFVGIDGQFKSEGAMMNGAMPYSAGTYWVTVISYFNTIWQSPDVLFQTGENGIKLPAKSLSPGGDKLLGDGPHFQETRIIKIDDFNATSSTY